MSLLTRLGRLDGRNEQVMIFSAQKEDRTTDENVQSIKMLIHRKIVEEITPEEQNIMASNQQDNAVQVDAIIQKYFKRVIENNPYAISLGERNRIVSEIRDEMMGLGPIEPLLKDDSITEIMINGAKKIFVERLVTFHDNTQLNNVIERILSPIGRRIDESSPLVDARLADGSRVNIIIPPLSIVGPAVTIRKFSKKPFSIENLVNFGTMNSKMAKFLRACVQARVNILVSGGTGSGKTTTLNVLSSFIPNNERIVTIEDAAELRLQQDHVVTLESRPANLEGKGEITIRDLVRNALRMRPDRIIVGEVRAGEALDMLQAMNTGHDGSLTTAHANTPRDALARLETMVLMSGFELPERAIREQISSALELVLQQSRIKDGSRKVTYITEVQKMEGNTITTQDIFRFVQTGFNADGKIEGYFETTGLQPGFLDKFQMNGIKLPEGFFNTSGDDEEGIF